MRKGGSKQKGSEFERKICKRLSLWISDGRRKDIFWRSAMSGGRATVMLKSGETAPAQAGDVSAVDRLGGDFIEKFYVECKFYKNLYTSDLIYNGSSGLSKFWLTAVADASRYKKIPLLIAKQNFKPILLCLQPKTLPKKFLFNVCIFYKLDLAIVALDDFLKYVRPETFVDTKR